MYGGPNVDFETQNRQMLLQGTAALERTAGSLERSHQIAIETETIGTEVISELSDQRETLLRAKNRLTNADNELDNTRRILRKMKTNVLYNKLILILIIIIEAGILGTVLFKI